jgi:carboxypeptidase Taq
VTLRQFFVAINVVRPSFIRIEADEVTYNLHIILRFELERALIGGELTVADLPGAWNDGIRKHLHLDVPSDQLGCLQDIHWSAGLFGYFPTYSLGNLYAAQFLEQARRELGDLESDFRIGEFCRLRTWLREKIHLQGRRFLAPELCQRITGQPLSSESLIGHLRAKAALVYGI